MSSYPQLDPEVRRAYARSKRLVRYEHLNKVKSQPCDDCGIQFPPEAMDFDHVLGEKSFVISQRLTVSWKRLQEEIAKCDIVCACCHRIRTKQRLDEKKAKRQATYH